MHIRFDPDAWHSQQRTNWCQTSMLKPGKIVVADRKPFRIDRVTALSTDQWPDTFVEAWRQQGMPDADTWSSRPMRVTGFWEGPDADTKAYGVAAPAGHMWSVLPEHYSVCRLCHELPPCRHVHNEAIMARASERMSQDMSLLPGVCHGCREPITKRQKSFTFPGPNLIRPDLGDDSAVFHTRAKCSGALDSYDKRWADAEPGRIRFFYCEGTATVHHDGTVECDNPQCVGQGAMAELVGHATRIWHHPRGSSIERGCWCLASAT